MEQVKIQLKLVKSPLPGIKDDYTAIVVTNGTATAQDLVADAHESEPQISEIAAKQVFDTEWHYVGRMLAEGKYVNIGGIGLAPCVTGSLLHADEEVGSDRIGIQVTVYDNELARALKSMDVETAVDPDALPFVFTKVEDVTTNTFGVITPGGAFKTLGDRQSCGLEGERIEIVDASGVRHVIADATGDREGMWLMATAPAALAKGKATVTVWSRGKNTPEAEPTPSPARPVTVLAAATPVKKRVKVTFFNAAIPGGEGTTAELWIEGENLDGTTNYSHGEGDPEFFTAEASVNGGEFKRVEFEDRRAMLEGAPFGARVKLRLNIDPEKPEFDPTPVEVEDTVD